MRRIDAQLSRHSDTRSRNLAAALTVTARREGLERIDQVALSGDGERAFALQDSLPARMAHVQTAGATRTSIMESSAAWTEAKQQIVPNSPAPAEVIPSIPPGPQVPGR
ncbi:XVIPCD domain-containing protein [Rhodanobacter sp. UC4451_H18]